MALNQRFKFGLSVNGTPWASWLRVHGNVAMSAMEYSAAAEEGRLAEPLLQHAVEPLHLALVAVERVFGVGALRREHLEMGELAEHRPDAAHLEHQPLDDSKNCAFSFGRNLPLFSARYIRIAPDSITV